MNTGSQLYVVFAIGLLILPSPALEAAPGILSYQGVLEVGGMPFTGVGMFRFAIVDSADSNWTSQYWSNDGEAPPNTDVVIDISNGIVATLLGDSPQIPIPPSVFQQNNLYLAIWFNDGVTGSELLLPNQRLSSCGYALHASVAENSQLLDGRDGAQFLHSDEDDVMNGNLSVTGRIGIGVTSPTQALEVSGSMKASTSVITPKLQASADNSVATIDIDSKPNDAQGSGLTIGKIKAMAGQNNGQPYLWLRANGAHSWILDYTPTGTFWAQSIGAYYNNVKQGNIGMVGTGPTVDYISIGFGGPYWWNNESKVLFWKSGRIQIKPPAVGGGTGSLMEPTAWLVLAPGASAASSAPVKFRTGSLLSIPEAGAMEWDGNSLFVTNNALSRKTIAYTDSNITGTAANVTSTVAVTTGGTGRTMAIDGLIKGDGATTYSAAVAGIDYVSPDSMAADYLMLDQTNPQTTIGAFTFPALTVSALTQGRIPFTGADGALGDTSLLQWDNTNHRLGIGTTPAATFHVVGHDLNLIDRYTDVSGYGAGLALRRARGSVIAPSAVRENDLLGSINYRGYNGTDFSLTAAAIFGWASEDWTATTQGTYLTVYTTEAGSLALTEKLRITDAGSVGIGTSNVNATLHVVGKDNQVQTKIQGSSAQSADLTQWLNASGELLAAMDNSGIFKTSGYRSSDGTPGVTGTQVIVTGITQDPTTKDITLTTKTITYKNGIITSIN